MLAERSMRKTQRRSSGGVVRPIGSERAKAPRRIRSSCRKSSRLLRSFWKGAFTRMSWIDRDQSQVLETGTFFRLSLRKYIRTTGAAAASQSRAQGLSRLT